MVQHPGLDILFLQHVYSLFLAGCGWRMHGISEETLVICFRQTIQKNGTNPPLELSLGVALFIPVLRTELGPSIKISVFSLKGVSDTGKVISSFSLHMLNRVSVLIGSIGGTSEVLDPGLSGFFCLAPISVKSGGSLIGRPGCTMN